MDTTTWWQNNPAMLFSWFRIVPSPHPPPQTSCSWTVRHRATISCEPYFAELSTDWKLSSWKYFSTYRLESCFKTKNEFLLFSPNCLQQKISFVDANLIRPLKATTRLCLKSVNKFFKFYCWVGFWRQSVSFVNLIQNRVSFNLFAMLCSCLNIG